VSASSAAAYQGVLLSAVAVSFLTLIPLVLIKEPQAAAQNDRLPEKKASLFSVATKPANLKFAVPNLLVGSGAALLIPYLNLFFVDRFAISDAVLGALFSAAAIVTGVSSILGPRLESGLGGKIRAVVFTQAASLCFLLVMGFVPVLPLVMIAFLMRGALMNMNVPLYSAFVMEQVPESEQATVNSLKEVTWQVGWLVGPVISGIVQESYGFTPLFTATSVLYALSIVVTWRLFGNVERVPAAALESPEALAADCIGD
jgi:predicted MFS family arabinose efflux permease